MGLFKKKSNVKDVKRIPKNIIRIQVGRPSISLGENIISASASIINAKEDWSLKDFIDVLIEKYCPKIQEKSITWILSYKDRSLAVFDSGNGHVNILNEKMSELTIKDIVSGDGRPQMILHYINPSDIEEAFKTMMQNGV